MIAAMHRVDHVLTVHDAHVWTVSDRLDFLSAHVGVNNARSMEECDAIVRDVRDLLGRRIPHRPCHHSDRIDRHLLWRDGSRSSALSRHRRSRPGPYARTLNRLPRPLLPSFPLSVAKMAPIRRFPAGRFPSLPIIDDCCYPQLRLAARGNSRCGAKNGDSHRFSHEAAWMLNGSPLRKTVAVPAFSPSTHFYTGCQGESPCAGRARACRENRGADAAKTTLFRIRVSMFF